MVTLSEIRSDVDGIINDYGNQVRFQYFSVSFGAGSYFDNAQTLTQSGTDFWTSGLIQPVGGTDSSEDAILLEQGRIKKSDKKIYFNGAISTSGTFKVGIGSPVQEEYAVIPEGITAWPVGSGIAYKKVFMRFLPNGSLAEQ